MSRAWIVIAAILAASNAAQAQHTPASPYTGLEARPVKALSDEQIADLRAGRGMGLALPAELNGYPGPVHVLELDEKLALTGEQRTRVEELHTAMKAETVPLGERLIAQETDLDRQFATKSVTSASLQCRHGRHRGDAGRPSRSPPALSPLHTRRAHARAGPPLR